MIDYQLLEALSAVITEGGFEKAAKKLFLTQSAVSRRIRSLESLLGEPVVIRSQPPALTPKGMRLLNHLQQVLQLELELGIDPLSNTPLDRPLTIRLATNADSLATWLPEALGLTCQEFQSQLRFDLVVEDESVILNRMRAGEVMACISAESKPINGGKVVFLGSIRYFLVAAPSVVDRYGIESLADLKSCPCVAFGEHDKLQHNFLTEVLDAEPDHAHFCPSPEGFKQALIAGLGFGLLPELQINDELTQGKLVLLDEDYTVDNPLYWHYWQTEGPQLEQLRKHAITVADHYLRKS